MALLNRTLSCNIKLFFGVHVFYSIATTNLTCLVWTYLTALSKEPGPAYSELDGGPCTSMQNNPYKVFVFFHLVCPFMFTTVLVANENLE